MSVNLEKVLKSIQEDKDKNLKPENIRYGTSCLGVKGTLKPVTLTGGDTATSIYLQDETPVDPNGIWLNTDKTYENIYLENERFTTEHSFIFSNDTTTDSDDSNIIKGLTVPVDLLNCSYCQKGNIVHFFGYYSTATSSNTTSKTLQHYMFNFDTKEWTQLSNCPTPQGGGGCIWVNDDIYLIGTKHVDYYNYMYKYNVLTDEWTRLDDIAVDKYTSGYMITACYDGNDIIYFAQNYYIWKYTISTSEISLFKNLDSSYHTITSDDRKYIFAYYSGQLLYGYTGSYERYYVYKYNIETSSFDYASISPLNRNIPNNGIVIDNYVFCQDSSTSYDLWYGSLSTFGTGTYVKNTNTFSGEKINWSYPVCYFTNEQYDILINFYGNNASSIKAVTLNDKSYTMDSNTLLLYTSNQSTGKYSTQLFKNDKILNAGKVLTFFNDINFYDATNKKIIKNINTYYGNGTDWVKIK